MTTICRVQGERGRGPWKPGFSRSWVQDRPDHDNLQPIMEEFPAVVDEIMRGTYSRYHIGTGTRTEDQLRRWINYREYTLLLKAGYNAVYMGVYKIIAESDTQVLFIRLKPLYLDAVWFDLYAETQ